MIVYIKSSIKNGIKIGHNFVGTLEITLFKKFFGLKNDNRILFTYTSPMTSSYSKTRCTNILEKIESNYIDGGIVFLLWAILMGKQNGERTL